MVKDVTKFHNVMWGVEVWLNVCACVCVCVCRVSYRI